MLPIRYYPEDYVRLGSPFSTLLEVVTALNRDFNPYQTFVFASRRLPLVAVLMAIGRRHPVYVYYDEDTDDLFTEAQEETLRTLYGCGFTKCEGVPQDHGEDAVVVVVSDNNWNHLGHEYVCFLMTRDHRYG